ncbi:MAG: response regulator [Bacillota bacterium]
MAQTILVVDDDEHVLDLLQVYLLKEGYRVLGARDGNSALTLFGREQPDLVVLDIMMPGLDGLEVCQIIRKTSRVPIIMLTARDEDVDKILGLEMGADDYLTKPFNPRELLARIKAVLRRAAEWAEQPGDPLQFARLKIDPAKCEVKVDGNPIPCTPKEMQLLATLARSPGMVFTRDQLLEQVWGYQYFGDTRTVDTHIRRLRRKLEVAGNCPWEIKTIWGIGYKFEVHS